MPNIPVEFDAARVGCAELGKRIDREQTVAEISEAFDPAEPERPFSLASPVIQVRRGLKGISPSILQLAAPLNFFVTPPLFNAHLEDYHEIVFKNMAYFCSSDPPNIASRALWCNLIQHCDY